MSYPYGRAFTAHFYPLIDDAAYVPSLTAGNLVSAYLFATNPGLANAATGAGALPVSITGWTWDVGLGAFALDIPAIDDPDPTSTYYTERPFFLAVNWRLELSQQVQTTVQALTLERPKGHGTALVVTAVDLEDYYPDIAAYATPAQIVSTVAQATDDVRTRLAVMGYRWAGLTRPDRLKQVVVLRALAIVMLAQAQASGDKFFGKYAEYKAMYLEALEGLRVEYDASGDGVPDVPDPTGGGGGVQTLFVIR